MHAARRLLNRGLALANMRVETLTLERREAARLAALAAAGHFDRPVFRLPAAIAASDPEPVFEALRRHSRELAALGEPKSNRTGFFYDNGYFPSPDAQVLYCMIRMHRPGVVVEVGSGNSTRVARQAILDGGLASRIVSIDPSPRVDVAALADRVERRRVEELGAGDLVGMLEPGSMLFIDSSHELSAGGDLPYLFLDVLPRLGPGVLVHVHDIFLPYEYPREWAVDLRWSFDEQYLLQAILDFGGAFDVLWAGHHLQRTRPDFAAHFPQAKLERGGSFWMRSTGGR